MKKLLLILLAVLLAGSAFIYSDPELRRSAKNMLDRFLGAAGVDTHSATFYKWKDPDGVIQYTQEPPPEGTPFEKVEARTDVNVLPVPEQLQN